MSLDAIVWLVVGIGFGVGLSLMLVMAYSVVERFRLGQRLKRARGLRETSTPRVEAKPVPAGSVLAKVARAGEGVAAVPATSLLSPADVDPAKPAAPPVKPRLSIVAANDVVAKPAAKAVEKASETEVKPVIVAGEPVEVVAVPVEPVVVAPTGPKPVQSVEALFAEAFAIDKLNMPAPLPEPGKGESKA
jgi:hypothetical protein